MINDMINYSILFVEDEDKIRTNYINYLKRYYKNVYGASNGKQGYEVYKEKKPDIIIADIEMPVMNGIDMVKMIRGYDQTVRILMLTAHLNEKFLLEVSELKLIKYLIKPISRDDLKTALNLAIEDIIKYNIISNEVIYLKDNYTWNCNEKNLYNNCNQVVLTKNEKKILELFFSNINKNFSHDEITVYVWDTYEDKTSALKSAMKKLRDKLPKDTIINIYGEGFRLSI